MLEIGKKQDLFIVKRVDFGVFLGENMNAGAQDRVLLPIKQVPENAKTGDRIRVFLYRDSKDRPIATTREPLLTLHQIALLQVAQISRIGAFLNWGLEKDLLLPFKEQTRKVQEGEECLVALYLDKSDRLCATMRLYPYLKVNSPYVIGDTVQGRVYEISRRFGAFVAVDDQYSALVPAQEAQGSFPVGSVMDFRITEVREDGKLRITNRKKAYLQVEEDARKILEVLDENDGILPYDETASPEEIREGYGLSKAAFKRAIGHLMKTGEIKIE